MGKAALKSRMDRHRTRPDDKTVVCRSRALKRDQNGTHGRHAHTQLAGRYVVERRFYLDGPPAPGLGVGPRLTMIITDAGVIGSVIIN